MKRSALFTKTSKTSTKDADSVNARLLLQAGYVNQEMAGVYSYLPLGLRVLNNIERIVREEMNAVGGQEVFMSSLSSKEVWQTTNRWDGFDALFKVPAAGPKGSNDKEYGLNPTHEEVVTPIVKQHARSYKDLPVTVYQIQTKFRNEARPKSGLLRGREFRMKDMYSFHTSVEDLNAYYETVTGAYRKVFDRLGLGDRTHYTFSGGGAFTKEYSHEFQTINQWGEDTVYLCGDCGTGHNKEIWKDEMACLSCGTKNFTELKGSEVANIFKLGTRFSDAFGYTYTDEHGKEHPVIMGCYGVGTSRLMGVIAEVLSDERGLVWPTSVAPMRVVIVPLGKSTQALTEAKKLHDEWEKAGVSVLLDDRDASAGIKLADADLLGIPYRVVVSDKTLAEKKVELKARTSEAVELVTASAAMKKLS